MAEKNYLPTIIMGLIFSGSVYGISNVGFGTELYGLFGFLACSTGCLFFSQILLLTGTMTISIGDEVAVVSQSSYNEKPTFDYRNYHYKSIIAKVNKSGVTVTSVEDAIKTYSSLFNVGEKAARPFFQNQFVMTTLGLNEQSTSQVSEVSPSRQNKNNKINANFWDNVSEGVAKNEAKSEEICADPSCSKPVSAFDFRCFKCRGRFCADCETGKSIMCKACS
tara:strand:+ start:28 stop:693 length:666 start_codon:yes stop_codon:yes gene_type:complete